jgi:hypothetical protein
VIVEGIKNKNNDLTNLMFVILKWIHLSNN